MAQDETQTLDQEVEERNCDPEERSPAGVTSERVTSEGVTSEGVTSERVTSEGVTSEEGEPRPRNANLKSKVARWVLNLIGVSIIGYGIYWIVGMLVELNQFETTDDAQVEQYVSPINVKVPGYVKRIRFSEHQYVKKGDILLELDDSELKVQLQQAEVALKDAMTGKDVLGVTAQKTETNVSVLNSGIAELQVRLNKLKVDYARQQRLLETNSTTRAKVESLETEIQAMKIKLDAMAKQRRMASLGVTEVSKKEGNVDAAITRARLGVEMAKLQLEYATVRAPFNGWLGRRTMTEGQLVNPGQTVTYIIPDTPKWVVANFKESQIENLHVGQEVQISVDAFKNRTFAGKITDIAEATGSKFSLVPQDNATGNFVKIQQRIPVKIAFDQLPVDDNAKLVVGMMAVVRVPKR